MPAIIKLKTSGREYSVSGYSDYSNPIIQCRVIKNGKPFGATRLFSPEQVELVEPGLVCYTKNSTTEYHIGVLNSTNPVNIEITETKKYIKA